MSRIKNNVNDLLGPGTGNSRGHAEDRKQHLLKIIFGEDPLNEVALKPPDSIPQGPLGGILEEMVNATANRLQTPNGLAAACGLGTVSVAIGRGLFVASRPGMVTYPNVYILLGTPSGGYKSVTADPIILPLKNLQQEQIEKWRNDDYPKLMAEKAFLEAQRKQLLAPKKSAVSAEVDVERLQQIYQRLKRIELDLLEPRIYGENATTEAVAEQMSVNKGVYAQISTDARDHIKIVAGKYRNQGETDEGLYLKGWSNESYDSPRIGRKVQPMASTCLTCLLLTQPDMVRKMFGIAGFTEGGLLPRFLPCMADYPPQELRRSETEPTDTIAPLWDRLVRDLYEEYHDANPRQLKITAEAIAVMDAHYNSVAGQYKALKHIWPYAARWTEQAWRLAIILHAAIHGRKAHEKEIAADIARAAVAIADWFRNHQLAILGASQTLRLIELIQKVLELFEKDPTTAIKATDITRKRIVADAEKAKSLLELMSPEYLICREYKPPGGGYTAKLYYLSNTNPAMPPPERDPRVAQEEQPE